MKRITFLLICAVALVALVGCALLNRTPASGTTQVPTAQDLAQGIADFQSVIATLPADSPTRRAVEKNLPEVRTYADLAALFERYLILRYGTAGAATRPAPTPATAPATS